MEGGKAPVTNGRKLKSLQYLNITPRVDRMRVEVKHQPQTSTLDGGEQLASGSDTKVSVFLLDQVHDVTAEPVRILWRIASTKKFPTPVFNPL
jgi:hypothetical protein